MKKEFKLTPHLRTKGDSKTWCFKINTYVAITKKTLKKHILDLYPTLKIKRIYKCKSLKNNLVVLETDKAPSWIE